MNRRTWLCQLRHCSYIFSVREDGRYTRIYLETVKYNEAVAGSFRVLRSPRKDADYFSVVNRASYEATGFDISTQWKSSAACEHDVAIIKYPSSFSELPRATLLLFMCQLMARLLAKGITREIDHSKAHNKTMFRKKKAKQLLVVKPQSFQFEINKTMQKLCFVKITSKMLMSQP